MERFTVHCFFNTSENCAETVGHILRCTVLTDRFQIMSQLKLEFHKAAEADPFGESCQSGRRNIKAGNDLIVCFFAKISGFFFTIS